MQHIRCNIQLALGHGLTRNVARHIFLLEPFLSVGDEAQARSRCHRIGQTREVPPRAPPSTTRRPNAGDEYAGMHLRTKPSHRHRCGRLFARHTSARARSRSGCSHIGGSHSRVNQRRFFGTELGCNVPLACVAGRSQETCEADGPDTEAPSSADELTGHSHVASPHKMRFLFGLRADSREGGASATSPVVVDSDSDYSD